MSVKSSARIKKRRSAEAAAASAAAASSGSFASVSSQRNLVPGNCNTSSGGGVGNSNSNVNANQNVSKKHNFVGRNPNFDTDETKLLIQLWGDPKLQRTLITTHKKHAVICQLAARMQEYGYHRSPEEITTRIKNLKCFYNRLKKDKECGLAGESEPSWKHFAEMDAIMTRPIFSVRPNEVPAPSLKYQLEQALEEHAERRKRRQENGEEASDSENEEDDILLSSLVTNTANSKPRAKKADDVEADEQVDMEVTEETYVNLPSDNRIATTKRRKISSETDTITDTGDPHIKAEPAQQPEQSSVESSVATVDATEKSKLVVEEDDDCLLLPLPKEEPIDVDAVDDKNANSPSSTNNERGSVPSNARSVLSTLADMLQLPKSTNLLPYSGSNVIIPTNNVNTSVSQLASTVSTNTPSTTGKLTPGKISLVPTNILMQPNQANNATNGKNVGTTAGSQLQLLQTAISQGARLMISGAAPPTSQTTASTGLVTGPGGVKFVLVNATDQTGAPKSTAATVGKLNAGGIGSLGLPQQKKLMPEYSQQQQQPPSLQHQSNNNTAEKREEKRRAQEKAREEQQSKRHMTTMRIMLRQLLNAQNEANEIQHNRLSLERERLDWEKSMGERLLAVLPALIHPATVAAATGVQAATSHQSPQFIVSAAASGSTTQRMQPPKLLFTTGLPMGNGTVSMPHILTPKVIAAPASSSTPGNNSVNGTIVSKSADICNETNDIQLVTPKLENEG